MSFVHPLLAWGALLGVIPIIIHILSRRRYRVVRWAAMDFLLTALSQRSRNLRIQDLILLALRTLALAAAALVVARPILSPGASELFSGIGGRGPDAVIVLDTSYSMGTNVAGQTRLALARQRANTVLASLPERASVGVVYMHEQATRATDGLIADRPRIGAAIDAARVTATGTDAAPALAAALEMLKGSTAPGKRVYLITDLQARAFDRAAGALRETLAGADASIGFVVLSAGSQPAANLGITDLRVKSRWLRVGAPVRFDASMQDFGDPPASQANVELWVDGRKVDRQRVLLSDRRGIATFRHAFTAAGLFPIEVRLDPDAVDIDNHRYAGVCIPSSIEVAVVTPEATDGPSGQVRKSPYVYLEAALSPPTDLSEPVAAPPFTVRPRVAPERVADEIDEEVRVVILAETGSLPADAVRRLEELARQGGSLLIAAGANAAATLGPFRSGGAGAGRWLSDVAFTPPESSAPSERRVLQLDVENAGIDAGEPVEGGPADVAVIDFDSPGVRDALAAVNVFQAMTVEPAGGSDWSVLLRLTDGRPVLMTRDLATGARAHAPDAENKPASAGRIAMFASSLDPSWCDLVYRPAMVPLLGNLLVWLTRHRLVSPGLEPGQTWAPPLRAGPAGLTVAMPGGVTLEAAGFAEPVEATEDAVLRFDRTDSPGVYRLAGSASAGAAAPDALHAVAVNVETAESDQVVFSPGAIRSLFPQGRCEVIAPDAPVDAVVLAGLSGTEVWSILAILVGAILLVEVLLAYRFSYQKTSGELRGTTGEVRSEKLEVRG